MTDVSIRVKYVESPPEAYTRQELDNLIRVSTDDDKLLWRFLLGTGFREGEASVAEYSDINDEKKLATVTEKVYLGFKPKDSEKRSVPIPDNLIATLAARKNGSPLIFGKNGKPDIALSGTLLAQAEGILAWAVEGLKQWRLHGLMEPETVINATTEYRAEEDTLMRFIQSDRLELGKEHRCGARELWQEYKNWCKDNHIADLSEWKFSDAMKMHGYTKLPRSNKGIQYAGIRIANQCTEATMQDFEQA